MPCPQQVMLMAADSGAEPTDVRLLANYSALGFRPFPQQARARWRISTVDGYTYTISNNNAAVPQNKWLLGAAVATDYEIRFTITEGAFASGTFGSWIVLSSTLTIEVNTTSGSVFGRATAEIRDVATQTIQTSGSIYLEADSS